MKPRALLAAALGLALPATAHAYVRTETSSGTPIAWTSDCLLFQADTLANPLVSNTQMRAALDAALAAWNTADEGKTPFKVTRGADVTGKDVIYDGTSVIIWRLPGFCDAASKANDEACLDSSATATTTVYFHDTPGAPGDGEIIEADMELNAVHFTFGVGQDADDIDLQSVFAHETGHGFGLDHTCYTSGGAVPLVDNLGNPQAFCFPTSELSESILSATMYPFIAPGETNKRGPTADETSFAATVYADYHGSCTNNGKEDGSGGCSVARAPARARWGAFGAIMGAFGILLAWLRRRR